ncbi:peroxisomal leader peptide-processing protease isoform X2 [Ahaetulla prasina]|uniref:peroxisomal leader peptide-processing protease isoform X2 n=1 Tax=Ahaetulla prasina TaxID=499056 RepID=UPI002649F285|nr:peroxisomal leader peptide-processing protease isoform X2 [Ahaetulla prasina]
MSETLGSTAARAGCVISVSHSRVSGGSCSGSGVLLSPDPPGLVLCPGILFSPFLLESERPDWSQGKVLLSDRFFPGLQIQVLKASDGCSSSSSKVDRNRLAGDLGENSPVLRFNPLSNRPGSPHGWRSCEAELLMVAACPPFQEAFSKIFRASDGWHFGGNDFEQEVNSLEQQDLGCLHWFALLRILEPDSSGASWASCIPAGSLSKGDTVFTCGSPFGSLCPEIFMNTLSKGIVSNLAGANNALLLIDARCLPGTEGGGVFVMSGMGPQLVGIIVAPLCWKSTEWVGLTLVCAIDSILESIAGVLSGFPWLLPMELVTRSHSMMVLGNGLDRHLLDAVVLVECGPTWGSGVMMNSRLLLTCRHVVSGSSNVCIRFLTSPNRDSVVKGKVVFATKDTSPYDIALVELEEGLSTLPELPLASAFHPGEDVSIVSFGVFGQACGPSVTSGILSAVITVEDKPVMLQATSAVHGGSSGGALFGTHSGKLLGIVASNTRDNSIGVTYPHLNFSIPITVLQSAILEYIHHGNLRGFQELDRVGEKIQVVWRLQREPVEMPLSKL